VAGRFAIALLQVHITSMFSLQSMILRQWLFAVRWLWGHVGQIQIENTDGSNV